MQTPQDKTKKPAQDSPKTADPKQQQQQQQQKERQQNQPSQPKQR
jgi:hypothetical protein